MSLQSLAQTIAARRFTVFDVARAYEQRTIEADMATLIIKLISRQDSGDYPCKHGIRSPLRLNGVPCCALCLIDHGYSCEPRQKEAAA